MLTALDKASYALKQGARVSWFMGHYFASRRYRETPAPERPERQRTSPPPGLDRIFGEMGALFARDLDNAARGVYPLPRDHDRNPVATSRRYFADLPVSAARKSKAESREVYSPELAEKLPAYFLQNFHYQTGGYLTEESAALYDMQVEVLFSGTGNAMRRQCLVPVADFLRGRDQRRMALLDAAAGTGRFARSVAEAFPRLKLTLSDLSEAYLAEAQRHMAPYRAAFKAAAAEALPFADASFDVLTCIFLFHEVPPPVRREIAGEFHRVLKPGGRLIFMDSLQTGDTPDFDGLLQSFPLNFHEPFYPSYLKEDLPSLFRQAGFRLMAKERHFLSTLHVLERD
jgi:ubiquinone/menaquinone biosynthesis C-methylase UbiE